MVSTMGNMMSPWLKSWVGMKPLKNASAAKKIKTVKTVVALDWECNAIYNLVMVLTILL
jgi:hypothetical protein